MAWVKYLPVHLKEQLLESSVLLARQLTTTSTTEQVPSVLVASLIHALFDKAFRRVWLPEDLQWDREGRMRALHRVHSSCNPRVSEAHFRHFFSIFCHSIPIQ